MPRTESIAGKGEEYVYCYIYNSLNMAGLENHSVGTQGDMGSCKAGMHSFAPARLFNPSCMRRTYVYRDAASDYCRSFCNDPRDAHKIGRNGLFLWVV